MRFDFGEVSLQHHIYWSPANFVILMRGWYCFIGDSSNFKQALLYVKLYRREEGGIIQSLIYRQLYEMCSKSDHFIPKYHCPPHQPEENKVVFNIIPYRYLPKASIYVMFFTRMLR